MYNKTVNRADPIYAVLQGKAQASAVSGQQGLS